MFDYYNLDEMYCFLWCFWTPHNAKNNPLQLVNAALRHSTRKKEVSTNIFFQYRYKEFLTHGKSKWKGLVQCLTEFFSGLVTLYSFPYFFMFLFLYLLKCTANFYCWNFYYVKSSHMFILYFHVGYDSKHFENYFNCIYLYLIIWFLGSFIYEVNEP